MFTWKPIYKEIAIKLLAYRHRQDELIAWLHEMKDAGIPVISLNEENPKGTAVPLNAMDPFSFFANFNRAIKRSNRIRVLEILKDKMGLSAAIPTDFNGLPHANMQKSIFFPVAYQREPHMVETLWDFATEIMQKNPNDVSPELFEQCLKIPAVGLAKLTIGMFWLQPDHFLSLDSMIKDYVKECGVNVGAIKTLTKYSDTVHKIQSLLGADYPQISYDAYCAAIKVPATMDQLDTGFKKLLERQAELSGISVEEVARGLAFTLEPGNNENEIVNRQRVMPLLAAILKADALDIEALKRTCGELWVLGQSYDTMHWQAFLSSRVAEQAIKDLLDDSENGDDLTRIDTFIEVATENGYSSPTTPDNSGAAQFASVLLSAVFPERFVGFRESRWNKLFALIMESKRRLCAGGSYGQKLILAGKFAAALANTDTFGRYFGTVNGTWKAAGLSWYFKGGEYEMNETESKQYWAGGHTWVTQGHEGVSHLEEFTQGNFWKTSYSRDDDSSKAKEHWKYFDQIKVGDEFAIKGNGRSNDLRVHYVGRVKAVDSDEGVIRLEKLERKLYRGKAPSVEGQSRWFGTIVSITSRDAIRKVFHGEVEPKTPQCLDCGLNTLLYGPPGTGKTYVSTHRAVGLVEGKVDAQTPEQKQERFNALIDEGRVAFITFHQSFAYEDFVEGIRPVLNEDATDSMPRYECKDGIFKRIAVEALYASLDKPESESKEAEFETRWGELVNLIEETPDREYEGVTEKSRYRLSVTSPGNIAGRNVLNPEASAYLCGRRSMRKVYLAHSDKQEIAIRDVNQTLGVGNHSHLAVVVFRELQKLFVKNEIRSEKQTTATSYEDRKQIVLEYLEHSKESGYSLIPKEKAPRYVLIIDEINRGNISKILGELVTLLESDKRIGAERQLRITLPYSGEIFGVPENLYIIGTMNTADKSIALVDIALRRRFEFEELMPNFGEGVCKNLTPDMRNVLTELNRRISLCKDRDHQIGHSYFIDVKSEGDFNRQFAMTTIALLQEYFYNDWDGLRFVLGEEKDGKENLVRSTNHNGLKWARNRWQWFFDAVAHEKDELEQFDYLGVLKGNYKMQDGGQQDET